LVRTPQATKKTVFGAIAGGTGERKGEKVGEKKKKKEPVGGPKTTAK